MTDDASPENLRKFLESDDPAMRRMGLSMAKGSGVPEELWKNVFDYVVEYGRHTNGNNYNPSGNICQVQRLQVHL